MALGASLLGSEAQIQEVKQYTMQMIGAPATSGVTGLDGD
jgi:hypothetical protein